MRKSKETQVVMGNFGALYVGKRVEQIYWFDGCAGVALDFEDGQRLEFSNNQIFFCFGDGGWSVGLGSPSKEASAKEEE